MPHTFDEVGFYERVFVLRHFCHGSREFCTTKPNDRGEDWKDYRQWMKSIVTDHLINLSIKLRILQDSFRGTGIEIDFNRIADEALHGLSIGHTSSDPKTLSIREACNKVIHATEVCLEWKESAEISGDGDSEYWSGALTLRGEREGRPWEVYLCVDDFSIALSRMIDSIDDVSWEQLYEHDS
jgi:hypothetical protein